MLASPNLDLHLALAHHLLAFMLLGIIVSELTLIRAHLTPADVQQVGRIDLWYGVLAGLLIGAGVMRAVFAAKGWAYYSVNYFFWAKMVAFAIVGLLSVYPTIRFIAWRQAAKADPGALPGAAEIARVRKIIWTELAVFALIPCFAAAMARGYGMMG
jgi:putative membrane protein